MIRKRCQNKAELKAFLEEEEMSYIMAEKKPLKYPCMLVICDYQSYEYIYPEDIYFEDGLPYYKEGGERV